MQQAAGLSSRGVFVVVYLCEILRWALFLLRIMYPGIPICEDFYSKSFLNVRGQDLAARARLLIP